jgi:hypothetical protein
MELAFASAKRSGCNTRDVDLRKRILTIPETKFYTADNGMFSRTSQERKVFRERLWPRIVASAKPLSSLRKAKNSPRNFA